LKRKSFFAWIRKKDVGDEQKTSDKLSIKGLIVRMFKKQK
jgi:hypothetical protein